MSSQTKATSISFSMALLAFTAFTQGVLLVFLPETRNTELPDTIAEAKKLDGKTGKV